MKKVLALILSVMLLVAGLPLATYAIDVVPGTAEELDGKFYNVGEVLYENNFDNEAADTLPAGWQVGKTAYIWNGSGSPSAKVWHSGSRKELALSLGGSDGLVSSPVINTRNYMFEAEIIANTGYMGIVNNMSGGVSGSNGAIINKIFLGENANSNVTMCKVKSGYSGISDKNFTLPGANPVAGETFKVKIISFEGKSYFYYNDVLVSTYSNIFNDQTTDTIGFFGCNSWYNVDNVVIKALEVANPTYVVGEKYFTKGEVLYENDFTNEATDTLPEGWEAGKTAYIWNGSGGVSAKVSASKNLSLGMSGTDGLVSSPEINTRNYMFEADIIANTGYMGIVNNMSGGVSGSRGAIINRISLSGGTAANVTFSKTANGVSGISEQPITLPGENPVNGEVFSVTIISLDGKSYFYYNGELVSTYTNILPENTTDCIGFFGCNSWFSVDNVKITALNIQKAPAVKTEAEKYAENTLGAELGDILLEEDFSKGSMSAATSGNHAISSDYTQKAGWEFFDTGAGVWHANAGSCIIANGYLNFYCSYGDSAVLLPQLNESNYIFTAKVKRGGWGHATSGAMALVTDIENDARNTSTFQRFSANFDGNAAPHTLNSAFIKTNSKTTNYTLTGTYDMAEFVDFTIISYKGMKYYFIENEFIASSASILNGDERIGFYISTKNIAVDDVVVKKLNVPKPAEEKFAATLGAEIGDTLLEEHFDKGDMAKVTGNATISGDYTQAPGWEFYDTAPFIWHNNAASFRISNGAANFWCSSGNAALMLPQLNESNYIFTAKIKRSGWGSTGASAGILTDLGADLSSDKPQLRFIGYYDSATDDGAFPFTKVMTRANGTERELTLENTYDMVSYIDFGVVSYEGTNYYFLNGDYVGSAAKVGGEGERLGFYIGTADISVDDVYVKALNVPFDSELTDVYGMNAIKVGTVSDNQTYKVDFEYIAENNFNVGFFTADADNANSIGYVEGANVSVFTAEASADVATATTYLTVDKKGGKADAIGSDLYMYVIGDAEGVEIANATATMLTDVTGENALVSNGGVSILKDVAENKSQAMRYYFTYDTTTGSDIVIDGEIYTVKSRGFLVANGNVNGGAQITRSSVNGTSIKDINSTNLNKCWDAKANGDALNSTELTYSMYVTGFKAVNGTYNNTNRLYVKGYIVVEIDGVEYTLYGAETNVTVSEVAAFN